MIRELMRTHDGVNIVAIDRDAGISEVNQLNRIKLMLVAKEKLLSKTIKLYVSKLIVSKIRTVFQRYGSCFCIDLN